MHIDNVFYLPSGRIFLVDCNGYKIECTEMRDVSVDGKFHKEVRSTNDPHTIWKHLVPYNKKWLLTVSTQKGCPHNCQFCDVAKLPFKGNLTQQEIENQVHLLLKETYHLRQSDKVKIGFARMGEPAHNFENVMSAIENLPHIAKMNLRNFKWLPCFNTILPKKTIENLSDEEIVQGIMYLKEGRYDGFLHVQISCNSTDEEQRKILFGGASVMDLETVIKTFNKEKITNRTITLNFIVMKNIEVDILKLKKMGLNKDKFTVKLIPLNATITGAKNGLEPYANYNNYEDLLKLKNEFEKENIPVVVDAIAKCEEAGLCCGQLAQIYQ